MGIFKSIAKGAVGIATVASGSLGSNTKHYVQANKVLSHRANNPVQRMASKPSSGISVKGK